MSFPITSIETVLATYTRADNVLDVALYRAPRNMNAPRRVVGIKGDQVIFESSPPTIVQEADAVPSQFADDTKFAYAVGYDGPIFYEFAANGMVEFATSNRIDGFAQSWGQSGLFGDLFYASLNDNQRRCLATPPKMDEFRTWQLVHPKLNTGSLGGPFVILLDVARQEDGKWLHTLPENTVSFEAANNLLDTANLASQSIIVYDRETGVPVARLCSPRYMWRDAVRNSDPNIKRGLFRFIQDFCLAINPATKTWNEAASEDKRFFPYVSFMPVVENPEATAIHVFHAALDRNSESEFDDAVRSIATARVQFHVLLAKKLGLGSEVIADFVGSLTLQLKDTAWQAYNKADHIVLGDRATNRISQVRSFLNGRISRHGDVKTNNKTISKAVMGERLGSLYDFHAAMSA